MKRTGFYSALALCLAIVLPAPASAADNTITFGAAISITGKTAKEGEYTRDGYQFALDTLNAAGGIRVGDRTYRLALRYYDDESRPDRAAQLYDKLIQTDGVNLLLGPYGSAPTAAIAPL